MEIVIYCLVGFKLEIYKYIVGFCGFFEDEDYMYILLELCRWRVSFYEF